MIKRKIEENHEQSTKSIINFRRCNGTTDHHLDDNHGGCLG